ncbi:hypothetical protein Tco_1215428 [Tanacetum coccineum]
MDNTLSMAEDDTDLVLETYSGEVDFRSMEKSYASYIRHVADIMVGKSDFSTSNTSKKEKNVRQAQRQKEKASKKGHNKTGCTSKKVDPPPNEVRSKGKKGGQSGFESAVSALKRMRMDVNGSVQNEEAHVQEEKEPTNADRGQMEPPT